MFSPLHIIGIDEAGRGALAGPVVAAAAWMHGPVPEARDSKVLTCKQREDLYSRITENSVWGVGIVDAKDIDTYGIKAATNRAMMLALQTVLMHLGEVSPLVLVDGNDKFTLQVPHQSFIGGDGYISSVSCASIIAKVTRDRLMADLGRTFSVYGFEQHKGYGTKAHQKALETHGPSSVHRKSYAPVTRMHVLLYPDVPLTRVAPSAKRRREFLQV